MLVFIIPVKSPKVSTSWKRVSQLFERCIRSICNQTSSQFRVIVVCNERPNIEFSHPYITYIEVELPVPDCTSPYWASSTSRERDKSRKIFTGLVHARKLKPSHVMFVDADDCVSKYLAEFVSQNHESNGWFVRIGYKYKDGSNFVYKKKNNFHQECGTGHIVKHDLIDSSENIKLDDIDLDFYHQDIEKKMEQKGYPLTSLPFIGAVYITENKENIFSQRKLILQGFKSSPKKTVLFYASSAYKLFARRRLTKPIRDEFGIYDIRWFSVE